MEKQEWLDLFDKTKDSFKWFFLQYDLVGFWEKLLKAREEEDVAEMNEIMNHVWFVLPDSKFNIYENPKGWNEFLTLLEA